MGYTTRQTSGLWALARLQHWVITWRQLREAGLSARQIRWRIDKGRLNPVYRGVYAVGRAELPQLGRWMAAVLTCDPDGVLSHASAAALWGFWPIPGGVIEVTLLTRSGRRHRGIRFHRRPTLSPENVDTHHNIPVTSPTRTLIDLATRLSPRKLERAVNEADKLGLVDVEGLRAALDGRRGQPGVAKLRRLLDRHTFRLTDSELERCFLPIVRRAGLPLPLTGQRVNGFRVDFFWPDLGLVVETDGLRYHRTPEQQAADRRRDQAHAAAGLTPLRFTHHQVRFEPRYVERTLAAVARRLSSSA